MSGNEIMKIIESNLPIMKTEVNAVIGEFQVIDFICVWFVADLME